LFLFSDGVVDLFGGPRLRRLGTKAWLEMLANAQNLPIAEQHATLCQALDGWQGKLEQEDDITVLGVEL
jgi:serine phosphatase RsbU (regulator of sigma subunit)